MAPMRLLLLRGLAVRRSRLHFPLVGTPTHRNPKRRSAARATAFGLHRLPPPPMLIAMRTLATAAAAAATSVSFDWATTCNSADGTRAGKCNNLASLAGGSAAGLYYLARSSGGTFALRKMNLPSQSTPASWPNYACDIDNIYDGCSVDASMTALTCPLQSRMVGLTDDGCSHTCT